MLKTNEVYNKDCMEGIKLLDDNSIDLVVIDPPYLLNLTKVKNTSSFNNYANELIGLKDGFNTDFYYKMCETMKDRVIPALKDGEDKMEYLGKTKTLPFFFRSSMIDICNMLIKSPNSKGEFLDSIRNNIKNGSKQYDISSKNFAFSIQSEKDAMETKNLDR